MVEVHIGHNKGSLVHPVSARFEFLYSGVVETLLSNNTSLVDPNTPLTWSALPLIQKWRLLLGHVAAVWKPPFSMDEYSLRVWRDFFKMSLAFCDDVCSFLFTETQRRDLEIA